MLITYGLVKMVQDAVVTIGTTVWLFALLQNKKEILMVNLLLINMKSKVVFLSLCICMMILSSCKNGEEESIANSALLRITTDIQTRSVIESTTFTTGDNIGIYFLGKYYFATYEENEWSFGKEPVLLTENPTPVYAFILIREITLMESYQYGSVKKILHNKKIIFMENLMRM